MRRSILFLLGLAVSFGVSLPFSSLSEALTVSPVRLEVSGDPGTSVVGSFKLFNELTEESTYYVSYANFEAQGENGVPNFVSSNEDLATWIHLLPEGVTSATLPADSTQEFIYQIDIPEDATPGGHFAAIFWGNNPEGVEGEEQNLNLGAKVGILLFLTVSGEVEEQGGLLEFGLVDEKDVFGELPIDFYYRVHNEGGDRLIPSGTLKIYNVFGRVTEEMVLNTSQSNVLPVSTRRFEEMWGTPVEESDVAENFLQRAQAQWDQFALGYYRAELDLAYFDSTLPDEVSTLTFWVFPWQLCLLLFVSGAFVLIVLVFTVRIYNRWIISRALRVKKGRRKKRRV